MNNRALKIMLVIGLALCSLPVWAASTAKEIAELRAEIESLKEGQQETQKTLEEIKQLLERGARPSAPRAPAFTERVVEIAGSPFKGKEDATLTLIEFSDYQCPFCARHFRDVQPRLEAEFVSTGQLKLVMKENPLPAIHKEAVDASLAALCAQDEGKYWEMHDKMFENQRALSNADLKRYAAEIGLDTDNFASCLDTKKHQERVDQDLAVAGEAGVRGTPGFMLGITDKDDPNKALMTVYIKGAQSIANFRSRINTMLKDME